MIKLSNGSCIFEIKGSRPSGLMFTVNLHSSTKHTTGSIYPIRRAFPPILPVLPTNLKAIPFCVYICTLQLIPSHRPRTLHYWLFLGTHQPLTLNQTIHSLIHSCIHLKKKILLLPTTFISHLLVQVPLSSFIANLIKRVV